MKHVIPKSKILFILLLSLILSLTIYCGIVAITSYSKTMNYDLIQSLLDREISCLEYLNNAGENPKFHKWCDEHGVVPDEQSAEFYVDMTVDFELLDPILVYDIY